MVATWDTHIPPPGTSVIFQRMRADSDANIATNWQNVWTTESAGTATTPGYDGGGPNFPSMFEFAVSYMWRAIWTEA